MAKTRIWRIWSNMKGRCSNPNIPEFCWYGGSGVTVCPAWSDSFEAFAAWAQQSGYSNNLELDRRDPFGNYEPENCRWATHAQQMQNTRKRRNAKTSRFKGVSLHSQHKRWVAQIGSGGRIFYIGIFDTEIEAANAYDCEARRRFGEYARINFPQGGVPR